MEAASTTSSAASSVDGRSSSVGANDFLNRGMFSSQQESLLMGAGGGNSGVFSMGNGFSNENVLSGGNGSSLGTSFDLSDFPSLGGGAGTGSGNGLAAALREQQQILAHQQVLQGGTAGNIGAGSKSNSNLYMLAMTGSNGNSFQMANEDFPALGGNRTQSTTGAVSNGTSLSVSSLMPNNISMQPGTSILENGLYAAGLENGGSQLEGGAGLLGSAGLVGLSGLRSTGTVLPSGSATAGAIGNPSAVGSSAAGNALSGDYGLLGLLSVIRMTDADRNALALGSDLQLLGLNLGTTEQLFSTFASPWSEGSATKEPHFQVRIELVGTGSYLLLSSPYCLQQIFFHIATNVLLHATASTENWTPIQVPVRNIILHFLRPSQGCLASVRSTRAVFKGVEVPWGAETVV